VDLPLALAVALQLRGDPAELAGVRSRECSLTTTMRTLVKRHGQLLRKAEQVVAALRHLAPAEYEVVQGVDEVLTPKTDGASQRDLCMPTLLISQE